MNRNAPSPAGRGPVVLPDLTRVAYFDGQRLIAGDLNDAATVGRELGWLHNRSLHGWGIGLGFAVDGTKGDRQVPVGPGYAVDCQGREIILTEPITKSVPARAGDSQGKPVTYFLVAAYPDDARLAVLERRAGECGADGAVRLQERAAIYWKAQGESAVEIGLEIVLAQASVQNCQLAAPLSLDQRRSARPPRQPTVEAGSTTSGATPWTWWTQPPTPGEPGADANGPTILGVRALVDTSEGRFGSTPRYQAQLRGERLIRPKPGSQDEAFLVDGLAFVSDPARDHFTLFVALPRGLRDAFGPIPVNPDVLFKLKPAAGEPSMLEILRHQWTVEWIGVEA